MQTKIFFLNNDLELIDTIKKGDDNALIKLYQDNKRTVSSFVMRNNGSIDDAEDILQDALIVLWENIKNGSFIYNAKLSTYIFATAKNLWLRKLSRKKHEIPATEEINSISSSDDTPYDILTTDEETKVVALAMNKIGITCRNILALYYYEELSMEEIAQKIGFANAKTVKAKKYQCKKLLQSIITNLLGGKNEIFKK